MSVDRTRKVFGSCYVVAPENALGIGDFLYFGDPDPGVGDTCKVYIDSESAKEMALLLVAWGERYDNPYAVVIHNGAPNVPGCCCCGTDD